jgi:TPR repeat protein
MTASVRCAVHLLIATLSALAATSCSSEDPCYAAYWDGSKQRELALCLEAANTGDPDAEFQYGLILWSGHDQETNHQAALNWFRKSAQQGHYLSQISLGQFLSHKDTELELKNLVEAYAWFRVAGASNAAGELRSQLTQRQTEDAERLALEFRAQIVKKSPSYPGA